MPIRLSDHTIGFEAAICYRAMGQNILKTLYFNKKLKGPDHFLQELN